MNTVIVLRRVMRKNCNDFDVDREFYKDSLPFYSVQHWRGTPLSDDELLKVWFCSSR